MNRTLLVVALLVTATVVVLPSATAKPPDCVTVDPRYPNPIQVDDGPCDGLRNYVCEKTLERLIPYNCPDE